jgi:acetoin utilization deacetylase AcuC-like enzyme
MRAFYHDHFELPLPPGHRFPIEKYARLRQRVQDDALVAPKDLRVSPTATDEELLRVHGAGYLRRLTAGELTSAEIRRLGLPWSLQLVERARRSVGGTLAAARSASLEGAAINLGGGTHHASVHHGAGFCVFNDVGAAARMAQAEGMADRVLILDCDVHQGDGTAAIFAEDPTIFTFSIHGQRNYPIRKIPGDLDLSLPDDCGDDTYLEALEGGMDEAFARFDPDLVLYLAGADPYHGDQFGRLSLTKGGLSQRDRLVLAGCQRRHLPTVIVMGGGYARRIEDIVDIHVATVVAAISIFTPRNLEKPG